MFSKQILTGHIKMQPRNYQRLTEPYMRGDILMELLEFLKQIPLPVLILVIAVLLIVTIVIAVQYMKQKGLDGIRADVYQLILKAEHMYNESGTGKQKFEWVIQQARGLLPKWLQVFVTEKAMKEVVQKWFVGVKDLLDDGKVNNSQK